MPGRRKTGCDVVSEQPDNARLRLRFNRRISNHDSAIAIICEMKACQGMRAAKLEVGHVASAVFDRQHPPSEALGCGSEVDVCEINGLCGVCAEPKDGTGVLFGIIKNQFSRRTCCEL